MQVKDTVRLSKNSQEILKSYYADDVNKAIKDMFTQVCSQNVELEKLKMALELYHAADVARSEERKHNPVYGVLTPEQKNELNPIFNEKFWDKLEDIYKKYVPNSKPFIRASEQVAKSNTPVKTFGKIDETEKLIEPVGRQGREVK